jgi:hypothetical protein
VLIIEIYLIEKHCEKKDYQKKFVGLLMDGSTMIIYINSLKIKSIALVRIAAPKPETKENAKEEIIIAQLLTIDTI